MRAINKTKPRAKLKREYIPQPIESEDEVETETPITNKKILLIILFSMANDNQTDDNEPRNLLKI